MLDARLTPLERNGWQVLRSAEGISPLANLGHGISLWRVGTNTNH